MTPLRALLTWLVLLALAFANGTLRVLAFPASLGDFAARQVAVGTGAALFGAALWVLLGRWPFARPAHAWAAGAAWVALTVLFELGLVLRTGRWADVAAQYALWEGSLWPLLLAWLLVAPAAITRLQRRRAGAAPGRPDGSPAAPRPGPG